MNGFRGMCPLTVLEARVPARVREGWFPLRLREDLSASPLGCRWHFVSKSLLFNRTPVILDSGPP